MNKNHCSNCKSLNNNMRHSNVGIGFCDNEDSDVYMDRVFEEDSCGLFNKKVNKVYVVRSITDEMNLVAYKDKEKALSLKKLLCLTNKDKIVIVDEVDLEV